METSSTPEFDPFSTVGLERRPWLDAESIHAAFRERARQVHPDALNGNASEFARLTAARDLIVSPASRLKLLAHNHTGSRGNSGLPLSPLEPDLGFEIGSAVRHAEQLLRETEEKSALEKAITMHGIKSCDRKLEAMESRTARLIQTLEHETQGLDAVWPQEVSRSELVSLANHWQYAQRWQDQVRTARFKLKNHLPLLVKSQQ